MFDRLKLGRQKYGLKEYLKRDFKKRIDKVFYRSAANDLITGLRRLGVRPGMTVCVHSALSRLGYIDGGAPTVIHALQVAVGESGCVLMPAFSMGGDMETHLAQADTFDVRSTPSSVGLIPETFRRSPEVLRSCHPTNSVCAWGAPAAQLLKDHDRSITPFGDETPYGRLADRDDAYILMLDTHLHSFLHHLQERVRFPNLFLDREAQTSIIDHDGKERTVVTKVMRRRTPYFVAVDGAAPGRPDWAILHDYALMFPARRASEVKRLGYTFDGFPQLYRRRQDFESAGVLTSAKLGRGEIGMLRIKPFVERIQPEFENLIDRYRSCYEVEALEAMNLPYS